MNRVSADVTQDPNTGAYYHLVRVAVPEEEVGPLENVNLIPGAPMEIFLQTDERTVLSYVVRPLRDKIMRMSGNTVLSLLDTACFPVQAGKFPVLDLGNSGPPPFKLAISRD